MLTLSAPHRQVVWGMLVHLKRPTALFHAGPASGAVLSSSQGLHPDICQQSMWQLSAPTAHLIIYQMAPPRSTLSAPCSSTCIAVLHYQWLA
jgi:hypothetical protein